MREVGNTLGIPVHVFGNETHMTAIVAMALQKRDVAVTTQTEAHTANFLLPGGQAASVRQQCILLLRTVLVIKELHRISTPWYKTVNMLF